MGLVGILGGLHALVGLQPDKTELVLDVVDHGLDALAALLLIAALSRRVGALELEALGALGVFAAVGRPEDRALLYEVEGVRDDLITGDNVLGRSEKHVSRGCVTFFKMLGREREREREKRQKKNNRAGQESQPRLKEII